jgi:3-deoxy-D-manno-octulosonic-acid transferase
VYHIIMYIIEFALKTIAFFSKGKIHLGVEGRKNTLKIIKEQRDFSKNLIWFHAASLGEFEQGRPLLEKMKAQYPDYLILLTFFSPSGYEIRKNYAHADIIVYLPIDTKRNATSFLEAVKPSMIFFIKYEFWYYFLKTATDKKIPTYYIAAIFRPDQFFFKWYGKFMQPILQKINHYFVQNEASQKQLETIKIFQVSAVGDTRVDRVLTLAAEAQKFPIIEDFCQQKNTMIIGSSWQKDEAILLAFINENPDWKFVIAPHEINENHLQDIENQSIAKIIRYSRYDKNDNANILLIDNIGMLGALYRYGKIAYIGGGFGTGIHNTLEPMAYNLPVIFGPNYGKFEEANAMISTSPQGAFCIKNKEDLNLVFAFLKEKKNYNAAAQTVAAYMNKNKGATDNIIDLLQSKTPKF